MIEMIDQLIELIEIAGDNHECYEYRNLKKTHKKQAATRKAGLIRMLGRLYRNN